MSKHFTVKSNARRAARAEGLDLDTLQFVQVPDLGWTWETMAPAAPEAPAAPAQPERVPVTSPDSGAAWRELYVTPPAPEPVEDAPEVLADKPAPRGKAAAMVQAATSHQGVTNAEVKALTGWSKLGGFFGAVERAGYVLHRCREGSDTRWFAVPAADGGLRAYVEDDAGRWTRHGGHLADLEAVLAAAEGREHTVGKKGEVYLSPTSEISSAA